MALGLTIKALDRAQLLPLKKRDIAAHKGDFGHVLIVGGDEGMGGAALLAGLFAARVGAGKVSVALHPTHVNAVIAYQPTLMAKPIYRPRDLDDLLLSASVVVLGPGLWKSKWSQKLCEYVFAKDLPMLIDGGACYWLAQTQMKREHWVLTPHVGEASVLLGVDALHIQKDRVQFVQALQQRYGGVAVLKGAGSLISDGSEVFICHAGNPGMASGGMGDALSGVIAGLMAQHYSLFESAKIGVFAHALAADQASQELGEIGLLATDLIPFLRELINY